MCMHTFRSVLLYSRSQNSFFDQSRVSNNEYKLLSTLCVACAGWAVRTLRSHVCACVCMCKREPMSLSTLSMCCAHVLYCFCHDPNGSRIYRGQLVRVTRNRQIEICCIQSYPLFEYVCFSGGIPVALAQGRFHH